MVGILLIGVRNGGAIITQIANGIGIIVGLAAIRFARTVIASIAIAIHVGIFATIIEVSRTNIAGVADAIAILVPEPGSAGVLLVAGAAALTARSRRRTR